MRWPHAATGDPHRCRPAHRADRPRRGRLRAVRCRPDADHAADGHHLAGLHRGDVPARRGRWVDRPARVVGAGRAGRLQIIELPATSFGRMRALMEQYRDLPMDLADASLVALAEERGLDPVFTLDSDFHVYRLSGGRTFIVIP